MNTTVKLLLAPIAAVLVLAGAARAQGDKPADKPAQPATEPAAQPASRPTDKPTTTPATGEPKKDDKSAANQEQPKVNEPDATYVKMSTSKGDIFIELNNKKAPVSTRNFLSYVDKGHYNGTVFHRVIRDFMVQGGGYTEDLKEKGGLDAPIKNEWTNGLKNTRGSVAMARTADHNSATSQFFINVKDNDFLDQPRDGAGYAVFGKVVAGMSTVDKIKDVKTTNRGVMQNTPVDAVTITTVARSTKDEADKAAAAEKK